MRRKDAEREEARRLRAVGLSVKAIAKQVGVSVSSVSVWVRDIVPPSPSPSPSPSRLAPPALPPPRPAPPPPPPALPPTPPAASEDEPRKHCARCGSDLPLSAFNRDGDGHQHWCRECFRTYFRGRGDKHREQSRAARDRRREAARAFVRDHLAAHPCVDCGEDDVIVLEFDHHQGVKGGDIARLVGTGALLPRLREEIERCEVVCVNCHRRRTARRAGTFRATRIPPAGWTRAQVRNGYFMLAVLAVTGCCDCGEDDPVVLDFDHVGEKRMNVSVLGRGCGIDTLHREIEQCVIRCGSCHRLRTLAESTSWRAEEHWAREFHSNPSET